ncbi:AGE family epimerase/isomerase [Tessaracoccus coleopterorum]|uniref:AGE family epimerase/isomerase n=1 Tax=Tessaracoccus coleopterorum TaxID=2714950 RepID=UPI001E6106BE|nr:AGE family epimerase/isomerase [Tessaracoccus coleopterorum]
MMHCFSIAHLLGRPGAAEVVEHGLDFYLDGGGRDHEYGGFYATVGATPRPTARNSTGRRTSSSPPPRRSPQASSGHGPARPRSRADRHPLLARG